jgi:hypothetical protein
LNRFLSKDFLAGSMFIAFGLIALWFGRNLALGTTVRMGPGYVPHTLAEIMMVMWTIVSLLPLFKNAGKAEKQAIWIPAGVAALLFILAGRFVLPFLSTSPWVERLSSDWLLLLSTTGVLIVLLVSALVSVLSKGHASPDHTIDTVEMPKWRPITMVTIGIVAFALLLEPLSGTWLSTWLPTWLAIWLPPTGMFPALVALVFIASLGGDEFKLWEVVGNIVVLTILCILVFKVGLSMNIGVINGVW